MSWSQRKGHTSCVQCGTTSFRHKGRGLCVRCYSKKQWLKHRLKWNRSKKVYYQKNKKNLKGKSRVYYQKNKNKISKQNKIRFKKKMDALRDIELKSKLCLECDKKFMPTRMGKHLRFCSLKCRNNNWRKRNKDEIKKKGLIYYYTNKDKKKIYDKRYREKNKVKKERSDKNYYKNNYDKLRMMSRIREIFMGKFPHNYNNMEGILLRDIEILKKKIMWVQNEIKN